MLVGSYCSHDGCPADAEQCGIRARVAAKQAQQLRRVTVASYPRNSKYVALNSLVYSSHCRQAQLNLDGTLPSLVEVRQKPSLP